MVSATELGDQLHGLGINLPPLGSIAIGEGEPIFFAVHDGDPVELWMALRDVIDQTGYWPLLTGDESILQNLLEWPAEAIRELPQRMAALDARSWLDQENSKLTKRDSAFREQAAAEMQFNEARPQNQFELPYHAHKNHLGYASPLVVLVPTNHNWQIPLFLCFGNFNHCPSPEEHACILRYWHVRYGAEIMTMVPDALELYIPKPPELPADAFALARDQYAYCNDMNEFHGSVSGLASHLLGSTRWFFWWD
jgi:hypothetical protein